MAYPVYTPESLTCDMEYVNNGLYQINGETVKCQVSLLDGVYFLGQDGKKIIVSREEDIEPIHIETQWLMENGYQPTEFDDFSKVENGQEIIVSPQDNNTVIIGETSSKVTYQHQLQTLINNEIPY